MRLYIELYLDEDVDVLLATLMRSRGFGVETTVEAHRRGTTDEQQLVYAADTRRTILTHNRADFEFLAANWLAAGKDHAGILIAVRRPIHELARRLLPLLNTVTADEMENQLLYL